MNKAVRWASLVALLPALTLGLNVGIKKEQAGKVKKLAVISVYSNAQIINSDVRAGGGVAPLGFAKQNKEEEKDPAAGHFGGQELVQHALESFAKELDKVKGWTVKDPAAVIASPAYKAFVESHKKEVGPKGLAMTGKFRSVPDGMVAYLFLNNQDKKKLTQLMNLCGKLGVDAVAIVSLDLSLRSTFATAGAMGNAIPVVSTTLTLVTRKGVVPVAATGPKIDSPTPVSMTLDTIPDSPAARQSYKQAIGKSAAEFRDTLNKELP
jgi:hypothetical protein